MSEKTYTLAEVRERERKAYAEALYNHRVMRLGDAEDKARLAFPDLEPARRWVSVGGGYEYTRDPDGSWWVRSATMMPSTMAALNDNYVAAVASLLPRVPVEVTEEMVTKAVETYGYKPGDHTAMQCALIAVAADLAQPTTTCQHKPTRWAVKDIRGDDAGLMYDSSGRAAVVCEDYDRRYADCRPHRVVALAEVEQL